MGRNAISYLFYHIMILVSVALVVAAEFCRRAGFILPEVDGGWTIVALVTPLLLLANGAMVVWWIIMRKWLLIIIPLVAFAINWDYISASIQLPKFCQEQGTVDLRIATLNVHNFSTYPSEQESLAHVDNVMNREGVDVLCLQEFSNSHELSAEFTAQFLSDRLPHFIFENGMAIASRFPILAHSYAQFPDTANDYMVADLGVGSDTVRLISVHLQTSGISRLHRLYRKAHGGDVTAMGMVQVLEKNSAIRAQQVHTIRQIIDSSPYPVILAGDFNDTPSTYTYKTLKQGLTDGFQEAGGGFGATFHPMKGVLRIDYILYDQNFEAVRYFTPSDLLSDHIAVIADLNFKR